MPKRKTEFDLAKYIYVQGATLHNLKNIDVKIPRNKFVLITGHSGSGKSTLAFDTIYAEGQRRYVESLSAYARQFLEQMKKPEVDRIEGLSPAISIDQKARSRNPRSTVGTQTEIYDYLRLLFAKVGIRHCPNCGKKISKQTPRQIVDSILKEFSGKNVSVLAPVVKERKGEYHTLFAKYQSEGFARVVVDGKEMMLEDVVEEGLRLDKYKQHTIKVVVSRLKVDPDRRRRLTDSVETALKIAEGEVEISVTKKDPIIYWLDFACKDCGISLSKLEPRNFSFNTPHGACPHCHGLGFMYNVSPKLVVPDATLKINEGAIKAMKSTTSMFISQILGNLGDKYGFDLETPFAQIPQKAKDVIFYGSDEPIHMLIEGDDHRWEWTRPFEGVVPMLQRRYRETRSEMMKREYEKFMTWEKCPMCLGQRLKAESLAVRIKGENIYQTTEMSVGDAVEFFAGLDTKLNTQQKTIAKEVLKEINERLRFLSNVGLDYLTLNRGSATLSGGESQRIRLATQIGSRLVGVLYILDEPSIGLHQRDNLRLIETLKELRDIGNTLIVVEHDEETIRSADWVIDLGPGAGIHGGEVVSQGTPKQIAKDKNSPTGRFMSGRESIPVPEKRREPNHRKLVIRGAKEHNLKNIDVEIPLGMFLCVTGVSGSGKSTLVDEILYRALARRFYNSHAIPGEHDGIDGLDELDKVIIIDQSPIGRTPRSNPATYTGVFTDIRNLFAMTADAKKWGYKPGRFSFNVPGGRCESCHGAGLIKIEMQFLADVYVPCEQCKSARYNPETLDVKYKGKNIVEVLNMTVNEAVEFFKNIPKLKRKLGTVQDVGLGYVTLGQPATTLSGGEAQRVKLSNELGKRATGRTMYLLDEPTTGLHSFDIKKLLNVLQRLADGGNTVLVIEHNLDVIKSADHVIDLGPEGGDDGGEIVAAGTPEEIVKARTYTGKYLKKVL